MWQKKRGKCGIYTVVGECLAAKAAARTPTTAEKLKKTMTDINILLNNILRRLEKVNSPLAKLFNPGVDKGHINLQLEKYKIEFPDDIYSVYEWRNGVVDSQLHLIGNIKLFTMGIFSSFQRSCKFYQDWSCKDNYWSKSMFPIFESGGKGFHLLECDPKSNNYGMIYFYDIGAYEFDTIIGKYDSIKALLESVSKCYDQGIYTYNNEGIFTVVDYERSFEISKEYNPHCYKYWNLFL